MRVSVFGLSSQGIWVLTVGPERPHREAPARGMPIRAKGMHVLRTFILEEPAARALDELRRSRNDMPALQIVICQEEFPNPR